ncbi:hypothetical protein MTR_8g098775 [Medicago truncatula]|uniref:Uncharacterized protein n=1 Tax=Medicago truncatula TaxID=3880 RepID=A0A072TVA4_MEDTR|nr:hypothetical protein MTR_8g098775 [Medicago truncatula]
MANCSCNFFLTNSIENELRERDEGDGVEMKCPIRVQENEDKCGTTNRHYWNWNPLKKLDRGTHQAANKPNKKI